MPFEGLNINIVAVLPEILLTVLAIAVLIMDLIFRKGNKDVLAYMSIVGLLIILPVSLLVVEQKPVFGGMVISDNFSSFFDVIFILAAIFTILISMDYLKKVNKQRGEYYYIILFATLGMMVMASSNDLINLYAGLELMALSFYILVAFRTDNNRSVEGALKYLVLGALSSGILLYGISFAYGSAGTTNLLEIARHLGKSASTNPFWLIAIVLITVGFSFKVALFPFHIWVPDTYEGAPTPVTALLSVGSKAAAFAVFLRVFIVAFPALQPDWSRLLWLLSACTMIYGSVVAISQRNIIRMLAYSSITHAGIIIMGLLTYNAIGVAGVMYYLLVYTFMNMGAFAIVTMLIRDDKKGENISDYKGLASRHPVLSFLMALFLLSLAGIPPTGGFVAKFFILASAINAKYYWLAVIGILATAISLFFYAKVIFYMYMRESEGITENPHRTGLDYKVALAITAAGTVLIGVYPGPFMDMAIKAIQPFLL